MSSREIRQGETILTDSALTYFLSLYSAVLIYTHVYTHLYRQTLNSLSLLRCYCDRSVNKMNQSLFDITALFIGPIGGLIVLYFVCQCLAICIDCLKTTSEPEDHTRSVQRELPALFQYKEEIEGEEPPKYEDVVFVKEKQ